MLLGTVGVLEESSSCLNWSWAMSTVKVTGRLVRLRKMSWVCLYIHTYNFATVLIFLWIYYSLIRKYIKELLEGSVCG